MFVRLTQIWSLLLRICTTQLSPCSCLVFVFLLPFLFVSTVFAVLPELSPEEKAFVERGKIIRYSEVNWKPLSDVDSSPKYKGMIADYLQLIQERSGLQLQFVSTGSTWQDVLDSYVQQKIELIPALAKEDNIGRPFLATDAFAVFPLVIVTRDDSGFISETSKLSGKRVGVGKGYTSAHFLRTNYPEIQLVETKDVSSGLELLDKGRLDAFVGHLAVVSYTIDKYQYDLRIAGKTEFNFQHCIGVDPQYPELVSIINKVLATISEKEHNQIYNTWVRLQHDERLHTHVLLKILGGAALILLPLGGLILFLVLNNRRLKNIQSELEESRNALAQLNANLEDTIAERTAEVRKAHEATKILLEEKQRSEMIARELADRNELILQSVSEGIFGVDKNGNTTFVNVAVERILGYSASELRGQPIHEYIHRNIDGVVLPREECPLCVMLKEGGEFAKEGRYCSKAGVCFPVKIQAAPLKKNNEVIGAVVVFRDISEQLANEQRMIETQKFEAIGQLAAGVAHELRTPIQYIETNVTFLGEAIEDIFAYLKDEEKLCREEQERTLQQVKTNLLDLQEQHDLSYYVEELPNSLAETLQGIRQIIKIVQSMKELSHPGEGAMSVANLNQTIENAVTISKNEWKYVAELTTELDPELAPFRCSPDSWIQMLINLIVNCAHAIEERQATTPGPGLIEIRTQERDGEIVLTVMDNGSGVDEAKKDEIFKPFFTTKKVGKGTGQGLAFAHNLIVNVHKGSITCENRAEGGVVFEIWVPLIPPEDEKVTSQSEDHPL